jgi:Amidase
MAKQIGSGQARWRPHHRERCNFDERVAHFGSTLVDPNQPWDEDAPAVARLREEGTIILGKTTTPEFGWKGVTDSPLTGITRNPWNPERTPGGSSGGSAAALAAGIGYAAVGTDAAGSFVFLLVFAASSDSKHRVGAFRRIPQVRLALWLTSVRSVGPFWIRAC